MQGGPRDPRHVNLTAPYYGMGFYYPPPPDVSTFHLRILEHPFHQWPFLPQGYVYPPMVHDVRIPRGFPSEPTHTEDVVPVCSSVFPV
jgi:hypothetical protein